MPNMNTLTALTAEMTTFYSKQLIKVAEPLCAYRRHAKKTAVPKNNGTTVNWRKFEKFDRATKPLTEGVVPEGQNLTIKPVTANLAQYGDYVKITDRVMLHAVDNVLVETNNNLGLQAAETLDFVSGSVYCSGANVIFGGGKTSRGALGETDVLTCEDILRAAQFLKGKAAQKIDKAFWAVIHPDVSFDIMKSEFWVDVSKYSAHTKIEEGEIGKLYGVRFVETPNAITVDEGGSTVYQTLVYGDNAFGCVDFAGGNLQTIVKPLGSAGTADPLNQFGTTGWKASDANAILNEDFLIRIETPSSITA